MWLGDRKDEPQAQGTSDSSPHEASARHATWGVPPADVIDALAQKGWALEAEAFAERYVPLGNAGSGPKPCVRELGLCA